MNNCLPDVILPVLAMTVYMVVDYIQEPYSIILVRLIGLFSPELASRYVQWRIDRMIRQTRAKVRKQYGDSQKPAASHDGDE